MNKRRNLQTEITNKELDEIENEAGDQKMSAVLKHSRPYTNRQ